VRLCWLKEKSPHNQSPNTCKSFLSKITLRFFCSSKFLDEKNASEKKWELIMKVRRVQEVFPKFERNVIIFAAFGIFQLISESFERQI
jgi:hypothetical protein